MCIIVKTAMHEPRFDLPQALWPQAMHLTSLNVLLHIVCKCDLLLSFLGFQYTISPISSLDSICLYCILLSPISSLNSICLYCILLYFSLHRCLDAPKGHKHLCSTAFVICFSLKLGFIYPWYQHQIVKNCM